MDKKILRIDVVIVWCLIPEKTEIYCGKVDGLVFEKLLQINDRYINDGLEYEGGMTLDGHNDMFYDTDGNFIIADLGPFKGAIKKSEPIEFVNGLVIITGFVM